MKDEILNQDIKKLMFKLSIPAIIGMVIIGLYPFMDRVFGGQILGEKAMSAISIATPFTMLNNGIATLVGVGSVSILSRALGRDDKKTVDKIMGNLMAWIILFSTIITIFGITFSRKLIGMSGATGEILDLGVRYLRIAYIGSLFVNFTQSANMLIRGEGLMKDAMKIMGLGAFINIVLDPILMKNMGNYGIEGAAIATVVAQIIQAIVTWNYFKNKSKNIKITKIKFEKTIYLEMFQVGISAMIIQVLMMIQQTLLYRQSFKYGGEIHGILMSASLSLYAFCFIPIWGMSQGLQPIVGTNYGAQKYHRVIEAVKIFMKWGTILAGIFYLPIMLKPDFILSLFNINSEIIALGIGYFRSFYTVFILYGIMIMNITFFQSIGKGSIASRIVLLRQLILFVPSLLLFSKTFGINGVWFAQPIVDFIMIIVGLALQKKEYKRLKAIKIEL
ncbi:MATE family efflux transporter [Tissierella praeacuta]|uniref:MATE family efflux transporter n=1 Tax=Tissierella praeacuta TaxID=43131 RepID=UPI003341EE82